MVHPLGAGGRGPFAAALPFAQAWGMRITRCKLNSLAMYVPSSASIGMMRTGGSSANRGSLTTSRICCRSCGIRACAGGSLTASGRRLPAPHQAGSAERCARRSLRPDRRPSAEHRRPGLLDGGNELLAICQRDHPSPSSREIASTFFDSTSSAAVSASARSLRCTSFFAEGVG